MSDPPINSRNGWFAERARCAGGSMNDPPINSARQAILKTLPEETSHHGSAPSREFMHFPASHAKALHPDVQVVVGMRGAGKTFWWAALQEEKLRGLIAARVPGLRMFESAEVPAGFGERSEPDRYPGRDTLERLIQRGHKPRSIWRTVVLRALDFPMPGNSGWEERVEYVENHPEEVEVFLYERDERLDEANRHAVVLFDALDRCASDWGTMNRLIRGLLETALDLRPYRRLRIKCFLRTDQLDEGRVANFPDASKVLASKVDLSWPYPELYAMLFQYLGNDCNFREEVEQLYQHSWSFNQDVWTPPASLLREEARQREVFHAITGPWMGRDRRRGFPYTWVPGHLADAQGRTSPRSFLAAFRKAAEVSEERYRGHEWPIHYEAIKRGVQEASSIRKREMAEDYPWVDALMLPLKGQVVPCRFEDIAGAWTQNMIEIRKTIESSIGRLPPPNWDRGVEGLRNDLEELGVFLRMEDGRVNIPDVYRVAYGLGRRGGVRPLRQ